MYKILLHPVLPPWDIEFCVHICSTGQPMHLMCVGSEFTPNTHWGDAKIGLFLSVLVRLRPVPDSLSARPDR
jgi:hypothetical protein